MPFDFTDLQIDPSTIDPPGNPDRFEEFCLSLIKKVWNNPQAQRYGRRGQRQHGVDIFGKYQGGDMWGLQCKCTDIVDGSLSDTEIRDEVNKAKNFRPTIKNYIIATTLKRDVHMQDIANEITEENRKEGLFTVSIWSWDEIKIYLNENREVLLEYYPYFDKGIDSAVIDNLSSIVRDKTSGGEQPSKNFNAVREKYNEISSDFVTSMIFYQGFVYLIPEFYWDDRGNEIRARIRGILKISEEGEGFIVSSLIEQGILKKEGDLLYLDEDEDAKIAIDELLKNKTISLKSLLEIFK